MFGLMVRLIQTSGTYIWSGINRFGCDSISTLILTINNTTSMLIHYFSVLETVFLIDSTYYHSDGVFIDTVSNSFGCDSIVNLALFCKFFFYFTD